MRVLLFCFIFVLISCKTTKKAVTEIPAKESLVTYMKDSCSNKCPVYSLTIFVDGSYLYKGIANVNTIGEKKGNFNLLYVGYLKNRLVRMPSTSTTFQKIKDKPVTSLVYKQQKHQYHGDNAADYSEVEEMLKDFSELVD